MELVKGGNDEVSKLREEMATKRSAALEMVSACGLRTRCKI